jgi:hypothetical protein
MKIGRRRGAERAAESGPREIESIGETPWKTERSARKASRERLRTAQNLPIAQATWREK